MITISLHDEYPLSVPFELCRHTEAKSGPSEASVGAEVARLALSGGLLLPRGPPPPGGPREPNELPSGVRGARADTTTGEGGLHISIPPLFIGNTSGIASVTLWSTSVP